MKILSIQSNELNIKGKVFPNGKCNHPNAKPVYERLYQEYNERKKTNYKDFFWGFSKIIAKNEKEILKRALEIIGFDSVDNQKVLVLDIPDELCLVTDFYNFSDEIYAEMYPDELSSIWDSIFDIEDNRDLQVIFPYIDENMIVKILK